MLHKTNITWVKWCAQHVNRWTKAYETLYIAPCHLLWHCHTEELPYHFSVGRQGQMPLSLKSFLMFLIHWETVESNNNRKYCQDTRRQKERPSLKTFPRNLFFSFVILVSLMFDIKDVEIVFPNVVYSVIINLPCKTTAFGAKSDTKGLSLDLWCGATHKEERKKKGKGRRKNVHSCHQTKSVNFQTIVENFERQRNKVP